MDTAIYAFEDYGALAYVAAISAAQAKKCLTDWLGHDAFPSPPKRTGSGHGTHYFDHSTGKPTHAFTETKNLLNGLDTIPTVVKYGRDTVYLLTRKCAKCENHLTTYDFAYPEIDEWDATLLCEDCANERNDDEGQCIICEETIYGHPPNKKIAILDASGSSYDQDDLGDFTPGYYNIISYPFYADAMLYSWFHSWAIRKIRDLGPEAPSPDKAGYLSGMVCDECASRFGLNRQINWKYWGHA